MWIFNCTKVPAHSSKTDNVERGLIKNQFIRNPYKILLTIKYPASPFANLNYCAWGFFDTLCMYFQRFNEFSRLGPKRRV